MAAALAEVLQRRQRAEANTREAQAALGVEAERRRADQVRMASLEKMKNLSLAVGRTESEKNDFVSTIFLVTAEE